MIHSCPLNWIISMAGSFYPLIQFIRSHGLWFSNTISWILPSNNNHFVFFTIFLKSFQSSTFLDALYTISLSWHLLFYQFLECLIVLIHWEYRFHVDPAISAYSWTMLSREGLSIMITVLILLNFLMKSSINLDLSLLFLIMVCFFFGINSFLIMMFTVRGAWSDGNQSSR